jgi:hypothetical protein
VEKLQEGKVQVDPKGGRREKLPEEGRQLNSRGEGTAGLEGWEKEKEEATRE